MTARYNLLNNIIGWIIFLIASYTYISCIEPTASFWDCGEYIACSYKLEVGHPPGAPTFMLFGRFFSLFAGGPENVAAAVNLMNALVSAGTILFMFWSLTLLGRKLVTAMKEEFEGARMWVVFASAAVGSLAYTFSDSFWFSAVEGEVYAMSSFFTALVFWATLRWDADDSPRADRWIVFIAYMIGLSIGVHLLNLLTIPSLVFIIYFKKYNSTNKGLIITGLVSLLMLGVVQNGIIPGIVSAAANYELFFVNVLGLPFNGGTIIYFLLLTALIVTGIMYTNGGQKKYYNYFLVSGGTFFFFTVLGALTYGKAFLPFLTFVGAAVVVYYYRENRVLLNTILVSFTVLLIGYSTFFILVIRSQANTPMDENNPENAINLLSYLQREQYGDWPLLYGPYYNAPINPDDMANDGNPVYAQDKQAGNYVVTDHRKQSDYKFAPEMCTVFPRMWEMNQKSHVRPYEQWGNVKKNHVNVRVKNYRSGEMETFQKPTMAANLRYFWNYQVNFMYMRYFFWNFAGKQNDVQGHGNITDGNWQSGIPAVSDFKNNELPRRMRENPANNKFFYIPFLLGLLGIWFHFKRDWKSALVVLLLFVLTGPAIVFYLNQYPIQPRERDYAYAASFYAFAFWIGFGVYALYDLLTRYVKMQQVVAVGLATIMAFSAPLLMAQQGWNDHTRANRYTARDFAKNYLSTCDKNAILFTNGDNDTFPLWYAQEVEDYRTDVRVLNLSLLNTDWYIDQANRKAYTSDRVPFSLPPSKYRQGSCDQVYLDKDSKTSMNARDLIDMLRNNSTEAMQVQRGQDDNGESYLDTLYILPTNKVYITVDKKKVKANGTVPANTPDSLILDRVEWTINKSYLLKADLMVLDLLASNNWDRPVYFAVTAGSDSYLDLDDVTGPKGERFSYFRLEGLAYRLVPMKGDRQTYTSSATVACDTDLMYDKIMTKYVWGGLEDTTKYIYMDENNLRFTTNQRLQLMTLAKLLNEDGKKDKAKKVLDYSRRVMPEKHVPIEPVMMYMVENYYRAGDMKSANEISGKLFATCEEEFMFYSKLSATTRSEGGESDYDDEAQRQRQIMDFLANYAGQYGQQKVSDDYEKRMTAMGIPSRQKPPFERQDAGPSQKEMDSLMKLLKMDTDNAAVPKSQQ
ncbi:MAG TPA: DUF2723 domain-containing protein [Bacteroidia bacterium]|nr:DUF2723 domain-containing protein [Bacteroidia bacterium]